MTRPATLPYLGYVCLFFASLVAACDQRGRDLSVYQSSLHNAEEFRALAQSDDSSAVAMSVFVLWLTSPSSQVAIPSCVHVSDQELSSLLPLLRSDTPPLHASVLWREEGQYMVNFTEADTSIFPGGHFWLQLRMVNHHVVQADMITEPESMDQADMLAAADELCASILLSGDGRERLLDSRRYTALAADEYPTIAAVREALLEWYTPRGANEVLRTWNIRELEGQVWVSTPTHQEIDWEEALPFAYERTPEGFEVILEIPSRGPRTQRISARFEITIKGWRLGEEARVQKVDQR